MIKFNSIIFKILADINCFYPTFYYLIKINSLDLLFYYFYRFSILFLNICFMIIFRFILYKLLILYKLFNIFLKIDESLCSRICEYISY